MPAPFPMIHRCPYIVGIDIFPLDTLPLSQNEESVLNQLIALLVTTVGRYDEAPETMKSIVPQLEELCGLKFDPRKSLKNQLLRTADKLCQIYNGTDSSLISYIPENAQKAIHLRKEWYQSCKYLTFENIILPVPQNYDAVLTQLYGDYMTPVQNTAGHDYPFYKKQTNSVIEKITEKISNGEKPFII